MNLKLSNITFFVFLLFTNILTNVQAESSFRSPKRILFIGNSYTLNNKLPQILQQLIIKSSDNAYVESAAAGGYYLKNHSTDDKTLNKIKEGNWDFVIIQEQSQLPSLTDSIVFSNSYPYLKSIDSIIKKYNKCAQICFYMTWGRKYGDSINCQFYPELCTYENMDRALRNRYLEYAKRYDGIVAPVGVVWNSIRKNYPEIELYDEDNSHPSLIGSVVAAYTFYSVLFRKNPFEIANYEKLTDGVNFNIKSSVHLVAFDKLNWWNIGDNDCIPAFSSIIKDTSKILLINQSKNSDYILWNYNKTKLNTNQSYNINFKEYGNYEIKLFAKNCFSNASHSSKLRYGGKGISLDTDKLIFLKYFKNSKFLQVNCDEHLNLSDLTIEIFSTDNKLLLKFTPQKYSSSIDLLYFPNFIKVKIKVMNKIILETGIQVH